MSTLLYHFQIFYALQLRIQKKYIELYQKGYWPKTLEGISGKCFRNKIRDWVKAEESCGSNILHHKIQNKKWTAEQRYELVAQVLAENSIREGALSNGINAGAMPMGSQIQGFGI